MLYIYISLLPCCPWKPMGHPGTSKFLSCLPALPSRASPPCQKQKQVAFSPFYSEVNFSPALRHGAAAPGWEPGHWTPSLLLFHRSPVRACPHPSLRLLCGWHSCVLLTDQLTGRSRAPWQRGPWLARKSGGPAQDRLTGFGACCACAKLQPVAAAVPNMWPFLVTVRFL